MKITVSFLFKKTDKFKKKTIMSHRTLPLLYLNLAGEMMYIIDDRLMYQKIPSERAVKGMNFFLTLLIYNTFGN